MENEREGMQYKAHVFMRLLSLFSSVILPHVCLILKIITCNLQLEFISWCHANHAETETGHVDK